MLLMEQLKKVSEIVEKTPVHKTQEHLVKHAWQTKGCQKGKTQRPKDNR